MSFNRRQMQRLKTYLDNNAVIFGALSDSVTADTMNAETETRVKRSMTGAEFFDETDAAQFDALTAAERQEWLLLCSIDELNPRTPSAAFQSMRRIFPGNQASSATFANLSAAREETVSHAVMANVPRVRTAYVTAARAL